MLFLVQLKPGILKLTIRRGQSNFSIVFIFVSCEEKGYYRVIIVSFWKDSYVLIAACTEGVAAMFKASVDN